MMRSKVVLFIPNFRWFSKRGWTYVPYTALILTALLKPKFDFQIMDANLDGWSEEECVRRIAAIRPGIVLLSGLSTEYFQHYAKALEIAKRASPGCVTVFGGVYPTVLHEEAIKDPHADYLFMGHAEERVDRFLSLLLEGRQEQVRSFPGIGFRDEEGRPVVNPVTSFIGDVKIFPKPDYSLIDVKRYLGEPNTDYNLTSAAGPSAILLTSFGCPYNCSFCAARTINGRGVLFRPAEDVLEEIDFLIKGFGVRNLSFFDECFLAKKTRVKEILQAFIDRNYGIQWKMPNASAWHLDDEMLELMKKSGCTQITISVESGSPRVLKEVIHKPMKLDIVPRVVKKCRELGIDILANFVIGLPGETWDEIRQTFRFAEEVDFDMAAFHIATPYPRSDLYKEAKEKGLLPENFHFLDPDYYGTSRGFITTDEFTPYELMVLRAYEWDRINFKTPEKTAKIAKLMNSSLEELDRHRKQTRLKCGVYSPEVAS